MDWRARHNAVGEFWSLLPSWGVLRLHLFPVILWASMSWYQQHDVRPIEVPPPLVAPMAALLLEDRDWGARHDAVDELQSSGFCVLIQPEAVPKVIAYASFYTQGVLCSWAVQPGAPASSRAEGDFVGLPAAADGSWLGH